MNVRGNKTVKKKKKRISSLKKKKGRTFNFALLSLSPSSFYEIRLSFFFFFMDSENNINRIFLANSLH